MFSGSGFGSNPGHRLSVQNGGPVFHPLTVLTTEQTPTGEQPLAGIIVNI
jgi:hypothetical protein